MSDTNDPSDLTTERTEPPYKEGDIKVTGERLTHETLEGMEQAKRNANYAGFPETSGDHDQSDAPAGDEQADLSEVPEKAPAVRQWLDSAPDAGEAARRADLAEAAEEQRSGENRSTVMDSITSARDRHA